MARLSHWRLFGLAVLLGLVMGLGHLTNPFLGLLSLAVIPLASYLVMRFQRRARAFWFGWFFGLGYFGWTMQWIIPPFFVDPTTIWLAPFAFFGMAGGLALFWGLASFLAVWLFKEQWHRILGWVLAWVFVEYLRANILTGFPWGHPFYVTHELALSQLTALFGIHGGFLILALSLTLPLAAITQKKYAMLSSILLVITLGAWGQFRLMSDTIPNDEALMVRVLQPDVPQHLKWHPEFAPEYYERQLELSRKSLGEQPDLIIWPETAIFFGGRPHDAVYQEIRKAAGPQTTIIAGFNSGDYQEFRNSLIYLGSDGAQLQYDKHHLVPFGEYFPMPELAARFGLSGLAELASGYSKGEGPKGIYPKAFPDFLPLICYEAIFPQYSFAQGKRPEFLVNITNDAWFGEFIGPNQHLTQARFRAIEQGVAMLRSANKGISAIIDPKGRVVASAGLGEASAVQARLPARLPRTLYARLGDWPAILVWIFSFGLCFVLNRGKRLTQPPS